MMYTYPYPRPSLTTDVVVFRNSSNGPEVLLIQRLHPPFDGQWALPGGFVEQEEPLEVGARRELREETGIELEPPLKQLAAFGDPGRDPRGWTVSVVFWTWLGDMQLNAQAGDDASQAAWWPLTKLPHLAFDHAEILQTALEQLQTLAGKEKIPYTLPQRITFRR